MGRRILFVTTDQQRYDALGCNGGRIARTPVIDGLAAEGLRYERAHPQNVVCMPGAPRMVAVLLVRVTVVRARIGREQGARALPCDDQARACLGRLLAGLFGRFFCGLLRGFFRWLFRWFFRRFFCWFFSRIFRWFFSRFLCRFFSRIKGQELVVYSRSS